MNRSHRRWHLAAWLVLTPITLVVLIAALAVRARPGHPAPEQRVFGDRTTGGRP